MFFVFMNFFLLTFYSELLITSWISVLIRILLVNANVFGQIIFASALVLTIRALEPPLALVSFALVPLQAYFIIVASRALIAPEKRSFLFIFHPTANRQVRKLLEQRQVVVFIGYYDLLLLNGETCNDIQHDTTSDLILKHFGRHLNQTIKIQFEILFILQKILFDFIIYSILNELRAFS